ncbi:MAG TPA: hypothetical protein VKG26_05615 [Bacteroidia bacterium]|nr:hypothetical protein [Bacteroidia bacterium]
MKAIHFDKKNARDFESRDSNLSVASLCNRAGILTFTCLVGYFFLMSAFKLQEILALRAFNFFILLGGIFWALHFYSKTIEEPKIDYFTGLKIGVRTVFTAVIPFAIFMALYLVYDGRLMYIIKESTGIGDYINPLTIAGAICIEGLGSGFITTFMAMQYFKKG